jgi:hypothetical protein
MYPSANRAGATFSALSFASSPLVVRDASLNINLNAQLAKLVSYGGKIIVETNSKLSIRSTCDTFNATSCGSVNCGAANVGSKGKCLMENVCECDESKFAADSNGKVGLPLLNGTGNAALGSYGDCAAIQEGKNGGKCKTGSACDVGEGSCNGITFFPFSFSSEEIYFVQY